MPADLMEELLSCLNRSLPQVSGEDCNLNKANASDEFKALDLMAAAFKSPLAESTRKSNGTDDPHTWIPFIETFVRKYVLAILCISGALLNVASIWGLKSNKLRLKRSISYMLAFLNLSDTLFLGCTFHVFCLLSYLANEGRLHTSILASIPYVMPLLQTFLTMSVYSTVSIAVMGAIFVQPAPPGAKAAKHSPTLPWSRGEATPSPVLKGQDKKSPEFGCCLGCRRRLRHYGIMKTWVTLCLVTLFGYVFNLPRWFELSTHTMNITMDMEELLSAMGGDYTQQLQEHLLQLENLGQLPIRHQEWAKRCLELNQSAGLFRQEDNGTKASDDDLPMAVKQVTILQRAPVRDNPDYVQYYLLISSSVVMVLVPLCILLGTFISFCRAIPAGDQKRKTLRIMMVIIVMFFICHIPKVVLTCYEIVHHRAEFGSVRNWSTWARITKEISHALLVAYSALNPLAYCGDLLFRHLLKNKLLALACRLNLPFARRCFNLDDRRTINSELDLIKSGRIVLSGPDPLCQQLKELDAQSRLLSGLPAQQKPVSSCNVMGPEGRVVPIETKVVEVKVKDTENGNRFQVQIEVHVEKAPGPENC